MSVPEEIRIRKAGVRHANGIASMQAAFFPWSVPTALGITHAQTVERMVEISHANKLVNVVAERNGKVVGYAAAEPYQRSIGGQFGYPHGEVGIITQVAVADEWRGQGIGAALIAEAITGLRGYGFSLVQAHITKSLVRWYRNLGWSTLPAGWGFAWIETHREGSSDGLPKGAPAALVGSHTPGYSQNPLNEYGYDILAFHDTGAKSGILVVTTYPPGKDEEESRMNVAKALIDAVDKKPGVSKVMPEGSQLLLYLESLSDREQAKYVENRRKQIPGD
jgi:predicted N-acetyltransferase YhbS